MLSPSLRARLSRIARGDLPSSGGQSSVQAPNTVPEDPGEAPLPPEHLPRPLILSYDPLTCGTVREVDGAVVWEVNVPLSDQLDDLEDRLGRVGPVAGEGALLIDIETAGLAGAPLFLIGLLEVGPRGLSLRQLLARDYTEEAELLRAFHEGSRSHRRWVTYNGAAFDLPYIRDRSVYHGLGGDEGCVPADVEHLDLLHAARKRWKGRTRNCRLETLEREIFGRARIGDVPGSVIPTLYHEYVRTSSWEILGPVLHHNALDLLTLAEIWAVLAAESSG